MRKMFTWIISILFCSVIAIAAREVVTDILSLKASSLPSTCQNGQVRFDTSTNILNKCLSNAWKPVVETTTAQTLSSKTFSDAPILAEIATPSTPSSGYGKTYFKSDGKLYTLNDAGAETEIGASVTAAQGRNYIINGDMRISQRGTSFSAIANGVYNLDRWKQTIVGTIAVHTVSQDTDVPTVAQASYLFQNSLRYTLTTPDTSIASTDRYEILQAVEGYNFTNLAQKQFTLSFWVKATLTGTYCVSFVNTGGDRSYVSEYTIDTTDTWEYKTITVSASPSAGTWAYTTGGGLYVRWALNAGSSMQTTADTWQTGNFTATSSQVNGTNTGATDFRITGVMLNEGSVASGFRTMGEGFTGEIANCQRYFKKSYEIATAVGTATTVGQLSVRNTSVDAFGSVFSPVTFSVAMRIAPSITRYSPNSGTSGQVYLTSPAGDNATSPVSDVSQNGFNFGTTSNILNAGGAINMHFTADAEI